MPRIASRYVGVQKCAHWKGATSICIRGNKYGFIAWMKSSRAPGQLPISIGEPRTPREAMKKAKAVIRRAQASSKRSR